MATLSHSGSGRLYSWWWDSHNSPKNSKWLQENLKDMDAKVKAMIKLIEEDADSFARRAEMYYKKRPELMKLVEEIYRAYRALAERYDHATVELRQAHRTMAEVFPNQVPYDLIDDSPSETSVSGPEEPYSQESQHSICSSCELNDTSTSTDGSGDGLGKRGLRQLDEDAFSQLSSQNQNLKLRAEASETEIQNIREMLTKREAEKEAIYTKYQQALEKLSDLERKLDAAQKEAAGLDHRAGKAEIEMKILKEALSGIESERDSSFLRYNQSLERISTLENLLSLSQEQAKALDMRADKAKTETQYLRSQLLSLETEKEDNLRQYKLSLEKISLMEAKISAAEENAGVLNEHIVRAESEVKALKKTINKLNKEKETASFQYHECLDAMAKMEGEIARFQNDAKQLNGKLQTVAQKLDSAEVKCSQLEESNQTLRSEADSLIRKITMKDQELAQRQDDLEKFQLQIQDEQSRFTQVETTLHALQKLHSQSQEEQRALSVELKNGLQMLKELGSRKLSVEEELQRAKEENRSLNESNLSSSIFAKNLEDEIFNLKETKDKLEEELSRKAEYSNTLEQEIHRLREEIKAINGRYQAIMMEVESVKELQNENAKLRDKCKIERTKGEILHEKLNSMDEISKDNAVLKNSLAEMNGELEKLKEKAKDFQDSCHFLQGEKTTLVAEKASLLLQLQIITENMEKLIEKNNMLENSLYSANTELEGLRGHSKSLEEFYLLLKSEKSTILNERDALVSQLESVERRLGNLEERFSNLEEKYTLLENENEATLNQVEQLRSSIVSQKEEHASYRTFNETKVSGLETHIHILQEKSRVGKREFEEELEKAVNAQVEIFILQKFVEDLEGKNYLMFIECQKLNETSRFSNKLISELERENLEQQVEIEFLVDEIENLRGGIHRVFKALQLDLENGHKHKIEREKLPLLNILDKVEELKTCFLKNKDEMQQLLVENSVLLTLLEQQRFEGQELEAEKTFLETKLQILKEEFAKNEKDKHNLSVTTKQLMFEITEKEQHEKILAGGIQIQKLELENLKLDYLALQEENSEMLKEKRSELHKFSLLKEANHVLEEEHRIISEDAVALSIFSLVCQSFTADKAVEMKALNEERNRHHVANIELKEDIEKMEEILLTKEMEILKLNKSVKKLMEELHEVKNSNDVLTHEIVTGNNFVRQKVEELSRTEQELKDVKELNAKLYNEAEELKMECKGSSLLRENLEIENLELCMNTHRLNDEITWLNEMNENLKSEVGDLSKEVEESRIREENLSAELQERRDGVELWDVEAASFYFDLQISSVREVFLENKLHEVTQVCEKLGGESAAKDVEIQSLRESIMVLESEMEGVKAKFSAYLPYSTSSTENVEAFEHCVLPQTKHFHGGIQEEMDDENTVLCNKIGARTKEFEVIEGKEKETMNNQETFNTKKVEVRGQMKQIKEFISEGSSDHEITKNKPKVDQVLNPRAKRSENGTLMKDIPLDQVSDLLLNRKTKTEKNRDSNEQMLQLWETVEKNIGQHETANEMQKLAIVPLETDQSVLEERKYSDSSTELQIEKELGVDMLERSSSIRERSQGGKKRKILQRLASDAQKLTNIQSTVHDLKKRLEKKNWSKKESSIEYEKVCEQVKEVEETITQLVTVNDQLTKNIEHSPPSLAGKTASELESENVARNMVMERARKGSEKIGRLHFEVQNMQLILMKLEEEKKRKWKTRFSKNKTGIILRDFIYSSRKNSEKQQQKKKKNKNKNCFCGCNRESTDEDRETNDL